MSRYELQHRLGGGGMGEVFEADRILPNGTRRRVACKCMLRQLRNDARHKDLFFNEIETMLDISNDHPNLVTVFDCIEDAEGRAHIIMELVKGCSLEGLLQLYREIEPDILRVIAHDVLTALDYVHEHGLVHRDVSPCNVLISRTGQVKISDFGLIMPANERTISNRFRGKFAYASPEALRCEPVDHRADLFSFAAMMYEQITKRSPYGDDEEMRRVIRRLKHWKAPRLPKEVGEDLRTLLMGLLHRDRDKRRPQNAREALTMLDMSNGGRARSQLAEMADALYTRAMKRRELPTTLPSAFVSVEAIHSLRSLGDEDAHADTAPASMASIELTLEYDTTTTPDSTVDAGHTGHDQRALAYRASKGRKRFALALGVCGLLAVGRYTLDIRGEQPTTTHGVVTRTAHTPSHHLDETIGPNRIAHRSSSNDLTDVNDVNDVNDASEPTTAEKPPARVIHQTATRKGTDTQIPAPRPARRLARSSHNRPPNEPERIESMTSPESTPEHMMRGPGEYVLDLPKNRAHANPPTQRHESHRRDTTSQDNL